MASSNQQVRIVVSMLQYEDGSYDFVIPDDMSTLDRLNMSIAARDLNTKLMNKLAKQLAVEIENRGLLNP